MACGNGTSRTQVFYPPTNINHSELPKVIRETPYVYNINNDKLTLLEIKNFPPEEDFLLNGLGFFEDEKNDPNKLFIFFVNHKRTGSVIEIFEHTLNTKVLTHLNTVKHDLIYTPNNVAPVSKNEFYVTNDHYSKNNEIVRSFEALARRPWSYVVFHSSITNTTEIVADGLIYPNGIASNWDKSKIYVSTTTGGELLVYDRKSNNKLHLSERVYTGICLDNVSVDENGEIYIAGTQKALAALAQLMDGSAQTPLFPAAVVKVSNNTNEDKFYGKKYSHKIIYEDNGNVLPAVTVAAVDGRRKVMLLGSFYSKGVGRCDFDDELL